MSIFQIKFSNHATVYLITLLLLTIVFSPFFPIIGLFIFIFLIFTAYFFRDPDRMVPTNDNLIVSPADGIITFIGSSAIPKELNINKTEFNKISIFLNIFNVHINRIPTSGKILDCKYIKGKFFSATLDKSSNENERNIITMETKNNNKIIFVQIAGLIARRIVSDIEVNQEVTIGNRFGIIKFGSRVDIYIPKKIKLSVFKDQKVRAGESVLADLNNNFDIVGIIKK